jgi:hypothetical protein
MCECVAGVAVRMCELEPELHANLYMLVCCAPARRSPAVHGTDEERGVPGSFRSAAHI